MQRDMPDYAIVAHDLRKSFGLVNALSGVNLKVTTGQIFGLLGPNGAGKTTTIRVLTTVLRADSGEATVLGHDVAKEPTLVRGLIGLAGQFAALDPNLTGHENLQLIGRLTQLPHSLAKQRTEELLERFGLTDAGDRLVKTYSGGMRRRLDLAASLLHRPPVIFLDEPTTGLDPESRAELWEVIRELVDDGATILLTTQYMEEADRLADNIAVIDHGQVIAEGTPNELKSRLGGTVIDIDFVDGEAAERASSVLRGVGVEEPRVTGRSVSIKTNDGTRQLVPMLRDLDQANAAPESLAVHEPSLDDVFLSLTGKRAENKEAAPTNGRRGRRWGS